MRGRSKAHHVHSLAVVKYLGKSVFLNAEFSGSEECGFNGQNILKIYVLSLFKKERKQEFSKFPEFFTKNFQKLFKTLNLGEFCKIISCFKELFTYYITR